MKPKFLKAAVAAVTVILLYLVVSHLETVSWRAIAQQLREMDPRWIALDFGLCLTQVYLWALRLWFARPAPPHPTFRGVVQAVAYGQFFNNFLPARGGEAVKILLLAKHTPKPAASSSTASGGVLASTGLFLADKIADLSGILLISLAATPWTLQYLQPQTSGAASNPWPWILGVCALGFILFLPAVRGRLRLWWSGLSRGLSGVANLKQFSGSVLASLTCWIAEIFATQAIAQAAGVSIDLPQAVFAVVLLNAAISVPISVANVGAFEGAFAYAFSQFGIPLNTGIAIATAHHAVQLVAVTSWVAGLWWFTKRDLSPHAEAC